MVFKRNTPLIKQLLTAWIANTLPYLDNFMEAWLKAFYILYPPTILSMTLGTSSLFIKDTKNLSVLMNTF